MAIKIPGFDKAVGKLVSSIVKQGGKAADDVVRVVGKKGAKYGDDAVKQLDEVLATITGKGSVKEAAKEAAETTLTRRQRVAAANTKAAERKASKDIGRTRFAVGSINARTPTIVKVAVPPAAAYAVYKYGNNPFNNKPEGITTEQWQDILTTTGLGTGGTPVLGDDGKPLDYYGQLAKAERDRYNATTFVPQSTTALDAQTKLAQQYGASTADAMDLLAGQYAQAAGGIKQRGDAGASAINDIYGQGASATDAIAAAPSDGMGGMIPVSGEEALAGQYSQAQGQSMADYLRSSGLIDTQAAGQLAGFTQLLGPAYQSQYNLLDQQARNAFDARQSERRVDFETAKNEKLQDALAEIEIQRALDARAASSVAFDPASLSQSITQWETIKDDDTLKAYYEAKGVTDLQGFIQYQILQEQRAAQAG
jgi:hypothetical protein